jgi:hypothetical protein
VAELYGEKIDYFSKKYEESSLYTGCKAGGDV